MGRKGRRNFSRADCKLRIAQTLKGVLTAIDQSGALVSFNYKLVVNFLGFIRGIC